MRTMKNEREVAFALLTLCCSYRKNCSLLSLTQLLLDPAHCSTSIRLYSLSLLLREQSLDMRWKSQQDPNCPASAPQTQVCVCVCVHEGGQSTMFAFLPGVGTLPLPAASRGQARCARRTRWTKHRREGGWSGEQGIVAFFCGDSALKAVLQIWLRGNLCPPHLYPDPDSDPSLSQLSILSQECPKAAEYQYLRLTGMSSKKKINKNRPKTEPFGTCNADLLFN